MPSSIEIRRVASLRSFEARCFIEFPYRLYLDHPLYVPPFRADARVLLTRAHPFFEHSAGEFFVAFRGGTCVGRIAALEPRRYNAYQKRADARFCFFDCADDAEAAKGLFDAVKDWARGRSLDRLIGPQAFSDADGSGILIRGFEHAPAMTMMAWNHPYYERLVTANGFEKYKDFTSFRLDVATYRTPDKVKRISKILLARGKFQVPTLRNAREIRAVAAEVGRMYNESMADHEEFVPYTDAEIRKLVEDLLLVTDPALIKIIRHEGDFAGFVFTFPDLSDEIRRARGRLGPLIILRLLAAKKKVRNFVINGLGIVPKFQKAGGAALLYAVLEETLRSRNAESADLTQIADSTTLMLKDVETLGGEPYKLHRSYQLSLRG